MNCKQTRSKLMDYHTGNLEQEATGQVEKHLADCVICLEFSTELKQFQHLLKAEKKPAYDPFLTNRIMEKVAFAPLPIDQTHYRLVPKLARVAAVVVLVLMGILGGLELGNRITSGLATGEAGYSEINSLVNEMELEPLEQMLLNLNNPGQ